MSPNPPPCAPTSVAARKQVLVLSYSQTGQLTTLVESLLAPLRADPRIEIRVEALVPRPSFPFPWSLWRFLDAFPE